MIKQRLKFLFIAIWLVGVLFLAIPTFSINLAGQEIKVNYSDRLAAKLNTSFGNFNRSFGVFNTNEVKATIAFTNTELNPDQKKEVLLNYFDIVNKRIEGANLYDIKLKASISETEYALIFDYPEHYSDPIKYTDWLTSEGKITFTTADQSNAQQIDLNDYDILGSLNLDYLDTIGSHIVFRVITDKVTTVNGAFSANTEGAYFLMNIDSFPSYFVIQYDQYANTNDDLVRALPTQAVSLSNPKQRNDFLNITRTYFSKEAFKDTFTVDSNITAIKPIYKAESGNFLALTFILSSLVLGIVFFLKFKLKKFLKYIVSATTFILTFVVFLKVLSGNVSISFLIGFIFVYFLANAVIYFLLETHDEENSKKILKYIRDTSIFGFVGLSIIYKLVSNINVMADFVGVILIGFMVLFIMSIVHFKFIFEWEVSRPHVPKFFKRKNEIK